MTIAMRYAARSDVGLVRANNQDSGYAGPHLLLVADGMGGHAGGDVASSLAVANLAPLDGEAYGSLDLVDRLKNAIENARIELVNQAREDETLAGMGTTVTALLRSENRIAMAHMGDSRAYILHDEKLHQATKDHTFVQHLVDTGKITPQEAETHPQRSVVMRVLGDFEIDLTPDTSIREARVGDRWLLCSDGLSGFVSHETLERTMLEIRDVDECADQLIQLALKAGGTDNITCIVAEIVDLDKIPDGEGPLSQVQVVGSVAPNHDAPTVAHDGPAARAAALLAQARNRVEELTAGDSDSETEGSEESAESSGNSASGIGKKKNKGSKDDDVKVDTASIPVINPKTERDLKKRTKQAEKAHLKAEKTNQKTQKAHSLNQNATATHEPKPGHLARCVAIVLFVALVLSVPAWAGYKWIQSQYFLAAKDGKVAVYQGIYQNIGPLELYSLHSETEVDIEDLPDYQAQQIEKTIQFDNLDDALQRIGELQTAQETS